MSRSSKGFADFFPTAPSVLQQKKSRTAQERKRQELSQNRQQGPTSASSERLKSTASRGDRGNAPLGNGLTHDSSIPDGPSIKQEDNESVQGDLLNGVGSASSTSTASSVFDAHNQQDLLHSRKPLRLEETPLTNIDSSSPGQNKSPAGAKQDSVAPMRSGLQSREMPSLAQQPSNVVMKVESPLPETARPSKGQPKGFKITYDPELDKTISSKERKARKPSYKDIISEVIALSENHQTAADGETG